MSDKKPQASKDEQLAYWTMHIQRWKESNMKQQAYCTQAGISYSTFVYWKGVLTTNSQSEKAKAFVPVKIVSSDAAAPVNPFSQDIKIKLVTGHTVCIPTTLDPKHIAALIHYLGTPHA